MANWILPFADKFITGHYGTLSAYRRAKNMQPHSGTDWARPAGTLIPAITSGTVKLIQFSRILGWVVVQTGWDEQNKKTKYIGYCHLFCSFHGATCTGPAQGCKTPLKATKVGDKVEVGQEYLRLGNSGSATTGPHLHATIGNTVKSVFGATAQKEDLHKFIKARLGKKPAAVKPANVQEVAQKAEIPATEKPVQIYACPHCKKELKK